MVKRATSLFNSFVAMLPAFPYVKSYSTFIVSDREKSKFVPLTMVCPRGVETPSPGMGEEGGGKGKGLEVAVCRSSRRLTP